MNVLHSWKSVLHCLYCPEDLQWDCTGISGKGLANFKYMLAGTISCACSCGKEIANRSKAGILVFAFIFEGGYVTVGKKSGLYAGV